CHHCMYRDVRNYLRHWEEIQIMSNMPTNLQQTQLPSSASTTDTKIRTGYVQTIGSKSKGRDTANKRYIDPKLFLPPRVKEKPSGGIASNVSSTRSPSTSMPVD
ncbi:hypothetical protein ACJMK2_001751, partial [Sinanodonta woodiana]